MHALTELLLDIQQLGPHSLAEVESRAAEPGDRHGRESAAKKSVFATQPSHQVIWLNLWSAATAHNEKCCCSS